MSKITLSPNVSGTGTLTIAAPNTNTDRTLTLPDNSGTLLSSASTITQNGGPAFAATVASPQSVNTNTSTKLNFTTETFDTAGAYDAANSRFAPQVAGYYQVNISIAFAGGTNGTVNSAFIAKNGGTDLCRTWFGGASGQFCGAQVSAVVYLNGSTDFIEAYGFHNAGGTLSTLAGTNSGFSAALVRAA